jgi:hypothetical protein
VGFFVTWIMRIGLLVAFVGGIMFALAIHCKLSQQFPQRREKHPRVYRQHGEVSAPHSVYLHSRRRVLY